MWSIPTVYSKIKNGGNVQRTSWTKASVLRPTWSLMKVKSCRVGPTEPSVSFTSGDTIRQKYASDSTWASLPLLCGPKHCTFILNLKIQRSIVQTIYLQTWIYTMLNKHTSMIHQQYEIWDVYTSWHAIYPHIIHVHCVIYSYPRTNIRIHTLHCVSIISP